MSEELGEMEKPSVDSFTKARKLIVVPLLFSGKDAPGDFMEKYNRCWDEIKSQLTNLENKLGSISHIYHEMVFDGSEKGLEILEQMNPNSCQIVKDKILNGADFLVVEDTDMALENIDWERCLMVAMGAKARTKIAEFHMETSTKRYEHVSKKIDESLKNGEIGLLFIREGHRTQFPQHIEVFNVYPPALDDLNRWLREYSQSMNAQTPES